MSRACGFCGAERCLRPKKRPARTESIEAPLQLGQLLLVVRGPTDLVGLWHLKRVVNLKRWALQLLLYSPAFI